MALSQHNIHARLFSSGQVSWSFNGGFRLLSLLSLGVAPPTAAITSLSLSVISVGAPYGVKFTPNAASGRV
jgi:hypothetical protein